MFSLHCVKDVCPSLEYSKLLHKGKGSFLFQFPHLNANIFYLHISMVH